MRCCTRFCVDGERLGGRAIRWAGLPTWTTHKVQHITELVNCDLDTGRICQVTSCLTSTGTVTWETRVPSIRLIFQGERNMCTMYKFGTTDSILIFGTRGSNVTRFDVPHRVSTSCQAEKPREPHALMATCLYPGTRGTSRLHRAFT